MNREKTSERTRKVVSISVRTPIYRQLLAICVAESNRRGVPVPVSLYLCELIARALTETDKQ